MVVGSDGDGEYVCCVGEGEWQMIGVTGIAGGVEEGAGEGVGSCRESNKGGRIEY